MKALGQFPFSRLRRLRTQPWLREMVAEVRLHPSDLIYPMFVQEAAGRTPIASLPGISRVGMDALIEDAKRAESLGIPAIALFPVVDASLKSDDAREALNPDNLVCRAVKLLKKEVPNIGVICDVALDPYTSHGHDGIVVNGDVANDETVEVLMQQALVLAQAGADVVAPSDMMDGRVGAIREALDEEGFEQVSILAYAAKYASAFYGPFREAVGSKSNLGKSGKHTYQMDARNSTEALREIALDIAEGADMVMVKPGMPYLDIVRAASDAVDVPVLAYQVSGEYAMIHAAAEKGWLDADAAMMEALLAFKRAGARAILTYAALDIAEKLRGQ